MDHGGHAEVREQLDGMQVTRSGGKCSHPLTQPLGPKEDVLAIFIPLYFITFYPS